MKFEDIKFTREEPSYFEDIEILANDAFGPGRFARTAFRIREGVAHDENLSFVAIFKDALIGSVRITPIVIGSKKALVLGPLMVNGDHNNLGIGSELMRISVAACRGENENSPHELVILVGDEPFYRPFGFQRIPYGQIKLPGPVDPARILFCNLKTNAIENYSGIAGPYCEMC